jgi:NADH-quinone oxidoreductase subunit L
MDGNALAYVTLFAPFVATVVITLFTLKMKKLSGLIALASIVVGLVCTILMATDSFAGKTIKPNEIEWLTVGGISLKFGVLVDPLSVLMSLVVTGVGSCIFLYSIGYMHGEEGYSRYFACLSLFAFSMLGIVFSTNFVQTFIFWELVGVSSYSLISYYFGKPSAVEAGKKAFLTNRIGDFGMTCGILLLFFTLVSDHAANSFSFADLAPLFHAGKIDAHGSLMPIAAFLIFTGAMAKSAQVPLHVWLPDAMEGPTPVSALMHAATMVAAGVYLVARTYFLFFSYEDALIVIAWLGGATALLAACMAFVQNDIKKVLAYSTLSQLGYMTLSLGLFGPGAAMFHLTTHAFFKALLFLGAGSVIHGCHHEQDMRKMGGLRKLMPVTAWTFIIGSAALAGIFPLAGFWSKDAILATAMHGSKPLYVIGVVVAFMTACYMGRAYLLTFEGAYRGGAAHGSHATAGDAHGSDAHGHNAHADDHGHGAHVPHESPAVMTTPLVVLAVFAVIAGFFSLPMGFAGIEHPGFLDHLLVGEGGPSWFPTIKEERFEFGVAVGGTVAALLGMWVAWMFYGSRKWSIESFTATIGPIHKWVENKFYFDDVYLWLVRQVQQRVADLCGAFEKNVLVQGIVGGICGFTKWLGQMVRLVLDGHLHRYVTVALFGVVVILAYLRMRG